LIDNKCTDHRPGWRIDEGILAIPNREGSRQEIRRLCEKKMHPTRLSDLMG